MNEETRLVLLSTLNTIFWFLWWRDGFILKHEVVALQIIESLYHQSPNAFQRAWHLYRSESSVLRRLDLTKWTFSQFFPYLLEA